MYTPTQHKESLLAYWPQALWGVLLLGFTVSCISFLSPHLPKQTRVMPSTLTIHTPVTNPQHTAITTLHTKVALNTASRHQLQHIPGIGPKKAAHIIAYRKHHGPFQQFSQLQQIKGIGPKNVERIRKHCTL